VKSSNQSSAARRQFCWKSFNRWLGLVVALIPGSAAFATEDSAIQTTFEKHVRPILKANCFDCHGEGEKLKGGLDLRLRRLIVEGGESGPAIKPGQPSESLLFQKIRDGEMPKREKKLSQLEIGLIEQWIRTGAPTAREEPSQASAAGDLGITPEEREFWSFQPIRKPAVPKLHGHTLIRTPIDAFVGEALSRKGLSFSPDAGRLTLLRRAYFDLIGLPPAPEAAARFLADRGTDAYERLIDELLASPRYGERWGRHWLDTAGYADSDGYTDADAIRNYAYKFRDYVIRSFNADKPFNEFIHEQLAGDEMIRWPQKGLTNDQIEKLAATGFLRMGTDGTATGGIDQDLARNQVVAETIKIVSTSLLGLSVGCAQCHDHRYDPIPQADYYRLRGILEPAYDWKNWRNPAQRLISLYTDADRAKSAEVEAEAQKVAAEKEEKQKDYIKAALEKELEKHPEALREPLRAAYNTPREKRSPEQKKLLDENPSVNIAPGVLYQYNPKAADDLKAMDAKIAEIRVRKPVEDFIQALTETPGQAPATFLFHRGDHQQPKAQIRPGSLTVLAPPGRSVEIPEKDPALPTSGRRLAFARWLTSAENPIVARVIVNRVWMHHFGRGIVGTPSDFGFMGEKPTHPELLDWLASEFMSHGWSFKHLHKAIMTSTVYRQSSLRDPKKNEMDPDNYFYWRKPVHRLDAEAIRDSILASSGAINTRMFGPPVPVREDIVGQIVVGIDKKEGDNKMPVDVPMGGEEFRRSVYIQVRRSRPLAILNSFDAPVMETNCDRRRASTAPTQALMLMNSDFILSEAGRFAERLRREAGNDARQQISHAWQLAFSRPVTEHEIDRSLKFIDRQIEELKQRQVNLPAMTDVKSGQGQAVAASNKKGEKAGTPKKIDPELQALTNFCQALLSANEFLYVD
jgi:mono/diheme cytochrome c family protein